MKRACLALLLTGCIATFDDEQRTDLPGLDGVSRIDDAGDACASGGVRVVFGVDADRNGALDPGEEDGRESLVCAGAEGGAGPVAMIRIEEILAGDDCAEGGQRVLSGLDADGDDLLDEGEVTGDRAICNGAAGSAGGDGLAEVSDEPAGANCAAGGQRVDIGLDANGDGSLTADEIASTSFACDGVDGANGTDGADGADALVSVTPESPGFACPAGGERVDIGLDLDGSGGLEAGEVQTTTFVCDGSGGGGGAPGGSLDNGVPEGSSAAPVQLDVTTFDPLSPHAGSVGAATSSFYTFTTVSDVAEDVSGPYTVAFHGTASDVQIQLFDDAGFTNQLATRCAYEAADVFVCSTAPLSEGTAYFVKVNEVRNLALNYALTVSWGARTGTTAAPVAIPIGNHAHSVHGFGTSYFLLPDMPSDMATVDVQVASALAGTTPVVDWQAFRVDFTDPPAMTCSGACPSPRTAGGEILIAVRELTGEGAAISITVSDDDIVTQELTLGTRVEIPNALNQIFNFRPGAGGGNHTFDVIEVGGTRTLFVQVFGDFADASSAVGSSFAFRGTVRDLAPELAGERVYLRLSSQTSPDVPYEVQINTPGGDQGSAAAPVPLALATPLRTSVRRRSAGVSFYALPEPAAAQTRFTLVVDPVVPGLNRLQCQIFNQPGFNSVDRVGLHTDVNQRGCILPPLDPGTTPFVLIRDAAFDVVYDAEVVIGDPLTPVLVADGGVQTLNATALPSTHFFQFDGVGPFIFKSTNASGNMQRRMFRGHPLNEAQQFRRCEGSSSTATSSADCERAIELRPGTERHYLRIDRAGTVFSVDLELVSVPILDTTIGVPTGPRVVADGDFQWLGFDVPTAGDYEVTMTFAVPGNYVLFRFNPDFTSGGSISQNDGPLVTAPLPSLTADRWFLKFRADADVTVDFLVQEVP